MRSLFFALRQGLLLCVFLCVCVCFEKSFIGRQCAGGIKSLMLVLMSQWKCLHSVIYKLHLPCLALHLIVVSLGNESDQREMEKKLLSHFLVFRFSVYFYTFFMFGIKCRKGFSSTRIDANYL